jgi:GNAT superfamily N-acetyltransferase
MKGKHSEKSTIVKVRRAAPKDARRIAQLSGQLGYPVTPSEIKVRLRKLHPSKSDAVLVGESRGEVIGWVHVSVCHLLEVSTRAEINGLIVADGQRNKGAGARLLQAAETWARQKKCEHVSVRSNVIREAAHAFYERHAFKHYKTQKAFRKLLR